MKSRVAVASLIGVWVGLAFGCTEGIDGNGKPTTEERQVTGFSKVRLSGHMKLQYAHSDTIKLTLSGDDNLVPLVTTRVTGDVLEVFSEKNLRPDVPLVLTVQAPSLEAVTLSGSTKANLAGLTQEKFELTISGAAKVKAQGTTEMFKLRVSGAGEIEAANLQAKAVDLEVSGAGEVETFASESLTATVSGAAKVRYVGNPAKIEKNVSGAATIESM